jgi:E3 ubiquitin-protein ligase RNF115/126
MQAPISSALYIAVAEIQRDVPCVPVGRFCRVFRFHYFTPRNRFALIEQPQQPLPPGSPSGPSSGPSNRQTSPSSAPPRPRSPGNSGRHGSGGGLFQSLFGGSTGGSRAAGGSSFQSRNSNSRGARRGGTSNEPPGSTPFFPGRWGDDED